MKKQLVCIMSVYGPQAGRAETEKRAFREEVERMVGFVEAHVMMCIAGNFNSRDGRRIGRGIRMGNKEPRGSRAGRIAYEKWAGHGRNILQEAGKPQDII